MLEKFLTLKVSFLLLHQLHKEFGGLTCPVYLFFLFGVRTLDQVICPWCWLMWHSLLSFFPVSVDLEKLHLVCPVRSPEAYVHKSSPWRKSDQLLVCFGSPKKGSPASKQTISKWIVEAVFTAYEVCSMHSPLSTLYKKCCILKSSIVGGFPSRVLLCGGLGLPTHVHEVL